MHGGAGAEQNKDLSVTLVRSYCRGMSTHIVFDEYGRVVFKIDELYGAYDPPNELP